jgi:DNA-binding transcriptional LysR family regulator
MKRDELGELVAFLAVCEERSFTRAAARLGTSQSALSHTVKRLEERLDLQLLTRTTRSVSPTDAGEQLAATLRPALDEIEARLEGLTALSGRPAGTIRITSNRNAARDILYPKLARLMAAHPEIRVEVSVEQRFVDIVAERFDAGVRLGESVERDMIAVRIGPDKRMLVAGAPAYFARHGRPRTPHDLTGHACINLRLPTLGGLYAWEFEKDGRPLNVRVAGQFVCNDTDLIAAAAADGLGLCCLSDDHLAPLVADGRLATVLEDWSPPFPGYHLYYPLTVEDALAFFENQPRIYQKLHTLNDVGLGYIHLGQSATTLSGGEAQRVKLATELSKRDTGRTFYILDEPTTGLHFEDVRMLLDVLHRLVERGNTVLVIEHNLDVIKTADWIVDLGPDGGLRGGTVVASGTPEQVAEVRESYTGQFLRPLLASRLRRKAG